MRETELLIPAGSLDVLKTAVVYGADAAYIGGGAFGLRVKARNFSNEEIEEGIELAYGRGVKVYVTANILTHNEDLVGVEEYLEELREIGPDAVIIPDPGVFRVAKRIVPGMEIHISTQANNTDYGTYLSWYELGIKRMVTARELPLKEIRGIRERISEDMKIKSFIHRAMCISYLGRCLLSNYFTERDASQGACTHPCRWKYSIAEETKPGEVIPVYENERGTYILSSKDLCMIEHVPEMIEARIDSFKIEGRVKTAPHVATMTWTYRKTTDDYRESPEKYRENLEWYKEEIEKCTYREFTTGFYFGKTDETSWIYGNNTYVKNYTYLGTVDAVDERGFCRIGQKSKFSVGEEIEVMKPDGQNLVVTVKALYDEDGGSLESVPHPKQVVYVDLGVDVQVSDTLRRSEME